MAISGFSTNFTMRSFSFSSKPHCPSSSFSHFPRCVTTTTIASTLSTPSLVLTLRPRHEFRSTVVFFSGDGGGFTGGGGGGGGGGGDGQDDSGSRNRTESIGVLAKAERSLESLPKDLAAAIQAGRIPGSIVQRYFELEQSPIFRWLLNFGGFKERLLADDLFLTKVAIECGVGIFTKVGPLCFSILLIPIPEHLYFFSEEKKALANSVIVSSNLDCCRAGTTEGKLH